MTIVVLGSWVLAAAFNQVALPEPGWRTMEFAFGNAKTTLEWALACSSTLGSCSFAFLL